MSNADERIRENMKSYNHLYENCISEENRRISLNLAKHSKRMRRIMKSRHLSDDALVALSYDWINNYENAEHVPVYIYDGITRKERVIIVPTMEEYFVKPSCTRPREKPENFPEKRDRRYTTPVRCCHILVGLTAPILIRCIGNGLNHISASNN